MSNCQKVRKSSPVKQGPMKATIPMASLLRHSNNVRKSPILSPTTCWRTRISPENSNSGQRSPGSISYKGKSKTLVSSGDVSIRRTASLDAIYLKGQWPRDNFYLHSGLLQVDKATQTEDINIDSRKLRLNESVTSNDDKLDKLLRQRLQRSKDGTNNNGRIATSSGPHSPSTSSSSQTQILMTTSPTSTLIKATPMNIPVKPIPKPPMRNSIEGLNQEIERLVLKSTGYTGILSDRYEEEKFQQVTPEGHRAPLADLLRSANTRSVNTQTPSASDIIGSCQSSGPPSRDSGSPLIPGLLDVSRPSSEHGGSQGSSPDQDPHKLGTSPHINRFLAREPPDGCERVNLRFSEQTFRQPVSSDTWPLKPSVTFQLRPSLGSAFYPLNADMRNEENLTINADEV